MEAPSYSGGDVGETAESIFLGMHSTPLSPPAAESFPDATPEPPLAVPPALVNESQ